MPTCKKCNERIPKTLWVNGRKRYISNHRIYCLKCSPFGIHNTKKIEVEKQVDSNGKRIYEDRICPKCGKTHNKRGLICTSCSFNVSLEEKTKRVYNLVGNECWICGYKKTNKNLCFHHVVPKDKNFGLSLREIKGYKWEGVLEEMKKCILVCHNCHGEIHYGLTNKEDVDKLFINKWNEIRARNSIG